MSKHAKGAGRKVAIARIVMDGPPPAHPALARAALVRAINAGWPEGVRALVIITPGGFVSVPAPESRALGTSPPDARPLLVHAERALRKVVTRRVLELAHERARVLAIGIDLVAGRAGQNRAELVAIYDLRKKKLVGWTGNSRTDAAEGALEPMSDLSTQCLAIAGERLVVLGSHDLHVWEPRSRGSKSSERSRRGAELRRSISQYRPTIVVQHPKTTDSATAWKPAWAALERENPSLKAWASGICYFKRKGRPRGQLENVLDGTKGGAVFDVILGG